MALRDIHYLPNPADMVLDPGPQGLRADVPNLVDAMIVPRQDASGVMALGRGAAQLGAGISEAGSAMYALAAKQMEAINIAKESEAEKMMAEADAEIDAALASEPDETKWHEIAQSRLQALQDRIGGLGASQAATEAIRQKSGLWAVRKLGSVKVGSAQQSFSKARRAYGEKLDLAAATGDKALLDSTLSEAVGGGYLSEDARKLSELKFNETQKRNAEAARLDGRKSDFDRLAAAIETDPWAARDALSARDGSGNATYFPAFDASDRMKAAADVEHAIVSKQQEGVEAVRNGIVLGEVDDQAIEQHAASLKLGAEDTEKLKQLRAKILQAQASREPFDWQEAARLTADIEAFNPDNYKGLREAGRAWGDLVNRAMVLSARGGQEGDTTGGAWRNTLYQKNPVHERRKAPDDLPSEIDSNLDAMLKLAYERGDFGPKTEQVRRPRKKMEDGKEVTEDAFEDVPRAESYQNYATQRQMIRNAVKAALKKDPNAFLNPGSLNEFASKVLGDTKASGTVLEWDGGASTPLIPFGPTGYDPAKLRLILP